MNALITKYTFVIVILAVLALIIRGDFFSSAPIIIIGQLFALGLVLYSRSLFRKSDFDFVAAPRGGPLIQKGPYKLIRHPVYAGAFLLIWISIIGHWNIINGLIGLVVIIFGYLRIEAEEKLLREHYPEYSEYSARTKKIIPFIY